MTERAIAYIDDLERHGTIDHAIAFEIKRRLTPALPDGAVAWRWRRKNDPHSEWCYGPHDPAGFNTFGLEVQPLYASPHPESGERPDNSLVKALEPTKAEARVRELLVNNGRNAANNRAGIPVGSTLHLCELLLCQIENARAALAHRSGT